MDNTELVKNVFNKNAGLYQEKYMDVSLYAQSIDIFCDYVGSDGAVLELACGPGNITRYMLDRCTEFNILVTDIAENMITLARENCPEATFEVMDCRDMNKLGRKFNGIMVGFVFPYLPKEQCMQVIADSAQLLESKGVLYISTMEDDYATSGWRTSSKGDKVYMYNHEADYLIKALTDNGFEITDVQRKVYDGWDGKPVTDLIIIGILG